MKRIITTILLVCLCTAGFSQSSSVEAFRQENDPDVALFFYKSTLRMFARLSTQLSDQSDLKPNGESPDFASLIDGIEKVKFFTYEGGNSWKKQLEQLEKDVEDEGYESVMTARAQGSNINILMREKRGKPDGFVVTIFNLDGVSLIDLDGMPDLNNLVKFSEYMNANTEGFSLLKNAFR